MLLSSPFGTRKTRDGKGLHSGTVDGLDSGVLPPLKVLRSKEEDTEPQWVARRFKDESQDEA